MRATLTILEDHLNEVSKILVEDKSICAYLLCGTSHVECDIWDNVPELRILSKFVQHYTPTDLLGQSVHEPMSQCQGIPYSVIQQAKVDKLNLCIVRYKIGTDQELEFDASEKFKDLSFDEFIDSGLHLLNLYIGNEELHAFIRTGKVPIEKVQLIRIIGKRFQFYYPEKHAFHTPAEFERQKLAFGDTLTVDLSNLRIGVIGCGATGSATSHFLVRLGVGKLLLIDRDIVEKSNLNRLYGATSKDAEHKSLKVNVLKDFLTKIGLDCHIHVIDDWVGSQRCWDAIKACDIVFSCTDDNVGRILLNRFAYFYHIPVIDMGMEVNLTDVEPKEISSIFLRVTTLFSGTQCMLCRKIVDPIKAREESLRRTNPEEYQKQKAEAYVTGEGNPHPAVITFTTETATMAVNELLQRLTGFRKESMFDHYINRIHLLFADKKDYRKPGHPKNEDCPICSIKDYWGTGDVTPFLDVAN